MQEEIRKGTNVAAGDESEEDNEEEECAKEHTKKRQTRKEVVKKECIKKLLQKTKGRGEKKEITK